MALCARAALLLGALQVLALLGAAMDGTAAQGKSAGGEEARCGGLPLHARLPVESSTRCGRLRGAGVGVPTSHLRSGALPVLAGGRPAGAARRTC